MGKWMNIVANTATTVIAVSALGVAGVRMRNALKPDPTRPHRIARSAEFAAEGHVMGPPGAAIKIVEFADYQCPFCQQAEPVLAAIRERYPHDVSIVFRHFPLVIHDSAIAAARAAECADQAGAFEAFHHMVMNNAKAIGRQPWGWFATHAGIADTATFNACVRTQVVFPTIERDRVAGAKLGVLATPTFLVNDLQVTGSIGIEELDHAVQEELARASRRGRPAQASAFR